MNLYGYLAEAAHRYGKDWLENSAKFKTTNYVVDLFGKETKIKVMNRKEPT